jgi:hypothetical protein
MAAKKFLPVCSFHALNRLRGVIWVGGWWYAVPTFFRNREKERFALKFGVLKKSPNYAEQFTSNAERKLPQSANYRSLSTTRIIPASVRDILGPCAPKDVAVPGNANLPIGGFAFREAGEGLTDCTSGQILQ